MELVLVQIFKLMQTSMPANTAINGHVILNCDSPQRLSGTRCI